MSRLYKISLGIALFCICIIGVTYQFLPPVVPLFYGRVVSEGQLVPRLGLIIPPILVILIAFINNMISKFKFIDKYNVGVLAYASFIFSAMVAITVVKIIFQIGFF